MVQINYKWIIRSKALRPEGDALFLCHEIYMQPNSFINNTLINRLLIFRMDTTLSWQKKLHFTGKDGQRVNLEHVCNTQGMYASECVCGDTGYEMHNLNRRVAISWFCTELIVTQLAFCMFYICLILEEQHFNMGEKKKIGDMRR